MSAATTVNIEVEQAFLGALLCQNGVLARCNGLQPEHFSEAVHARIYEAASTLIRAGKLASPITLIPYFAADETLEEIGGTAYLARLAGAATTILNAEEYARIVHDLAMRRAGIRLAEDALAELHDMPVDGSVGDSLATFSAQYAKLGQSAAKTRATVDFTPFVWKDPATLPKREWLYGIHYIRKFPSLMVATGGIGKSTLVMTEGLAMSSGRSLLGETVHQRCNVAIWNGEDPRDELERRVAAACIHHNVRSEEIEGRLFLNSGRDMPIVVARKIRDDTHVMEPVVKSVIASIERQKIDVLIIDPFVLSHEVPENDNGAIDRAVRQWARIADVGNCAILLVHHVRKGAAGQGEFTVEDGRGASAMLAAARSARVLNKMDEKQGEEAGVKNFRQFFRVDNGKANLSPPAAKSTWFKIDSVKMPNGDNVGVVSSWKWPSPLDDLTVAHLLKVQQAIHGRALREYHTAADWVGRTIAPILGWDVDDHKDRLIALIKFWTKSGALKVSETIDAKGKSRPIVEVGEWAD